MSRAQQHPQSPKIGRPVKYDRMRNLRVGQSYRICNDSAEVARHRAAAHYLTKLDGSRRFLVERLTTSWRCSRVA